MNFNPKMVAAVAAEFGIDLDAASALLAELPDWKRASFIDYHGVAMRVTRDFDKSCVYAAEQLRNLLAHT